MSELPYGTIPEAPLEFSTGAVLARLVDGIAFRYRWATEGLRGEDLDFRPCEDRWNIREVMVHVLRLSEWIGKNVGIENDCEGTPEDVDGLRRQTLCVMQATRDKFASMSDEQIGALQMKRPGGETYPVWNMINGPLTDGLTHIGQINSWRRLNGNPPLPANPFLGVPPE